MEKIKRDKLRTNELEKQKRLKKRKIRTRVIIFVSIILGVLLLLFIYYKKNKNYNSIEVVNTTELSNTSGVTYFPYKSGILKISRDGAEAINSDGKTLWNVSYNMKEPIGAVCQSYVAIADRGGTSLFIVDGSGNYNQITLLYGIEQVEVAAQGVTAVLSSNSEYNYINVFSMDSQEPKIEMETNISNNGFPIEIALSEDGKKLVTSYLAVADDMVKTWLTFYNFGEVGKNLVNNIAGSISFDKTIIPEIKFLNNDLICVYTDSGFYLYQMRETPTVQTIEEISGEIESVISNSSLIGFVVKSENHEGNKELILYNYAGKKVVQKSFQASYEKAIMTDNSIIFYSPLTYEFYDLKGNHMFSGTFSKNINYVFTTNQTEYLLCIGDTSMERIRLIETKEE